jgi:hypothetical protein
MHRLAAIVPLAVAALAPALLAQASWSLVYPPSPPPLGWNFTFGSHERLGLAIRLFGATNSGPAAGAWVFQGNAWAPATGPLPPYRSDCMLAFDAARDELVLFGGKTSGGNALDDTWRWNGTQWTLATPAARPPARWGGAMAFDRRRNVVVLFSGRIPFAPTPVDTWEWNGTTWSLRTPPASPPGRDGGMLAFDAATGYMLLHGGQEAGMPLADTWRYDSLTWSLRQPATPPQPRLGGRMVSDLHRQRVVLMGGYGNDPFAWEWDGAQWRASYQPAPAARVELGLVYDGAQRRVVAHGGGLSLGTAIYFFDDTWVYRTPLPADVVPFGAGCAGSLGTPVLANVPFVYPWLGDTMRTAMQISPSGGAIFVTSFGSTPPVSLAAVGAPGCDLLVPPDVVEFRQTLAGRAEWSLAIPNVPALASTTFRQQAFSFDVVANPLGLTASNGVTVTLGVR